MTTRTESSIGAEGRVLIPSGIRRAVGLTPGSRLLITVEDGRIVLTPRETAKRRLKEMFAGVKESMAGELIAERHAEAEREQKNS